MPVIGVLDRSGLAAVFAIYDDVRALQIVWTDSRGCLPGNPTTRTRRVRSPFLDQFDVASTPGPTPRSARTEIGPLGDQEGRAVRRDEGCCVS